MVVPEDAALPDFKDAIRFEPREITKYFEVGCWTDCWLVVALAGACASGPCGAMQADRHAGPRK